MNRIDFHSNVEDKLLYTCRLIRKARAANNQVVVLGERAELEQLDLALWEFSATDFLPHVWLNHELAKQTPILFIEDESTAPPHHDLLINLSTNIPSSFADYSRLIEVVANDEVELELARTRFRHYKQQGLQPSHITAKTS
jgi:DNA polymerase-3 subunit chi